MGLFILPVEIICKCAFYVLADTPLGPPHALLPLALTSRSFNAIVTSKSFLAKICRFKFDVGAINRRCFHPRDRDLADELIRCCRVIQEIRRADLDQLYSAYILMLNNDGKNYAQLQYAGLDAYVDKFVRSSLWQGRETNQGWPLDNYNNASALWLMWMTLTKEKLLAESRSSREEMIILTLPYVALPHRYPSASAPPNHFNLPFDTRNPCHQQPIITSLSPETPYPIYPPSSYVNVPYFNARMQMCAPLTTIPAKLLFVATKEATPFPPPPHLPQGPGPGVVGLTQEDFREFNKSPGARLCRVVTWDWDTGCPRRVGAADDDDIEIREGWEESKAWDTEWWRRLLCGDCNLERPKYLPGDVFKLGSMRGSWHGKEYVPRGNLFVHFLRHPNALYPGIPDQQRPHLFTENSIGLSIKPVFFDIQEHHKICECPDGPSSNSISDSHPYIAGTPVFTPHSNANAGVASSSSSSSTSRPLPFVSRSGRCGVVPIPTPLLFVAVNQPTDQQPDHAGHAEADENQGDEQPLLSDALDLSFPGHTLLDYSMSNAWFPGHVGGVSFAKVPTTTTHQETTLKRDKIICAVDFQVPDVRGVLNRPEASECLTLGGRREEQPKLNAYVYETYDPEKKSMHRGLEMGSGTNAFTTDNANANTSDPHKCPRCIQREELIRLERKKAERRSKRMLDRGLRSYERGVEYDWDEDENMYDDEEEGGGEDDDEEMRDVDVTGLNIDLPGIERMIAEATSTLTSSSSSSLPSSSTTPTRQQNSTSFSPRLMIFGDDCPYGEPGEDEFDDPLYARGGSESFGRTRRVYDKCRIGVECLGVGDVLLSGETGPRHAIWRQYTMYGRVRPWDGLIGILRSEIRALTNDDPGNTPIYNIFIFGYIVGENNFVGEWRVAASDPLRPTWGSAFVMSRRVGGSAGGGGGVRAGGGDGLGVGGSAAAAAAGGV